MRTANKFAVISIAMFAAGLSQAGPANSVDTYDTLDRNNDGKVSKSEAQADPNLRNQWDKLDIDRDNNLSEGEFARFELEGKSEAQMETEADTKSKTEGKTPGADSGPAGDVLDMK
ncbi:MAG: hypothetical protein ACPHER_11510 [Nevskiales bacterium]